MDMRLLNKGYTLIELLIVVIISSIFILFILNNTVEIDERYHTFSNEYYLNKSYALATGKNIVYDAINNISFNDKGNVNLAKTIYFDNNKRIIIELGFGVLNEE